MGETKHFRDDYPYIAGNIRMDHRPCSELPHYVSIKIKSFTKYGSLRNMYNHLRRLERAIVKRFNVHPDSVRGDLEATTTMESSWGEWHEYPVLSFTVNFWVSEIPKEDYKVSKTGRKSGFVYLTDEEARWSY